MDDERLILEVQKHNILYDTKHLFYKDSVRKERAWGLIAKVMDIDDMSSSTLTTSMEDASANVTAQCTPLNTRGADTCKTRWRVLRDSFVRNQKKSMPSGPGGGSQTEWKYKDIISFILPYLQHRSSKTNSEKAVDQSRSQAGTPTSLEEVDYQSLHIKVEDSEPGTSGEVASISTPPPQKATQAKRSQKRQQSTIVDNLMALLEEPVPKQSFPESDLDECYYFAMSLVPLLKRMDRITREETKFDILKCFENARKRQRHTDSPQQ